MTHLSIDKEFVQSVLEETVANTGVAGAQLSLQLGEERVDLVTGIANAELDQAMTLDTVVQIGSVTKTFNAMLIMTLVDEGKLDLDIPVKTYIPSLRLSDKTAEATVTLRHLLSMSSGVDNGPYTDHGRGDDALANYVASLSEIPHIFPPGQGFGYSNASTCIAGYAAECVTGECWDDLLKNRLLRPAGLTHAGTLTEDLIYQRVAVGHKPAENGSGFDVVRPWVVRAQAPAGTNLTVSAQDLASFGQIFLNRGVAPNGKRILSEESVQAMLSPHSEIPLLPYVSKHYCLGNTQVQWDNGAYSGHAGLSGGGASILFWIPQVQGVIACTVNAGADCPVVHKDFFPTIRAKILPRVFGISEPKPEAPNPPVEITNPERYLGKFSSLSFYHDIQLKDNTLWLRTHELPIPPEENMSEVPLVPLGNDRFLYGAANKTSYVSGLYFFGDDSIGRATTLVANFPTKRVS